jgi:hypothetical protein
MRKFTAVFLFVLFCGVFALAQTEPAEPAELSNHFEVPKTEISFGYAYQHASLNGGFAATDDLVTDSSTGLNGFAVEFSHYFHGNLGYTIDVSRTSKKAIDPTGIGYVSESFVAGPSYRLHRYGFFTPSIHVLAGADHATFNVPASGAVFSFTNTDFAALAGGALDGNLTPHIAIRLAQVDYDYTHHYGANQSSFRYLGGVVIRF